MIVLSCASIRAPDGPFGPDGSAGGDEGGVDEGGFASVPVAASDTAADGTATASPESEGLQAFDGDASLAAADSEQEEAVGDAPIPTASIPPFDTSDGGICARSLAPGDLVIDELMIESVAGSGDHGEWLEVQSTAGCAFDLRGLHGEAPDGSKVRTFVIGEDFWIPAYGTLVVADSNNPAINHGLPEPVVTWAGQPGDVLRNKGGTVTLLVDGVLIDSLTYPSMALTVGASVAFPSDCPRARRADWTAWQTSTSSWFPGFSGTPNAPNRDVQCP